MSIWAAIAENYGLVCREPYHSASYYIIIAMHVKARKWGMVFVVCGLIIQAALRWNIPVGLHGPWLRLWDDMSQCSSIGRMMHIGSMAFRKPGCTLHIVCVSPLRRGCVTMAESNILHRMIRLGLRHTKQGQRKPRNYNYDEEKLRA